MVEVSICLVNCSARDITIDCLNSIYKKTVKKTFEIILVDNASTDNSIGSIEKNFPEVNIVRNHQNLGFAKANNQALKIARGDYIILLNNDTELKNDAISIMADFLESNTKAGIVACKLYETNGQIQKNCRSFPLTPFDTFFGRASLLTKIIPNNPISRKMILSDWDYNSPRKVDWVSGAAMMMRRNVYDQIGGLDENYFMYWEDTDFCRRAADAGWENWYTPDAEIIHHTGKGGGRRSLWLKLCMIFQMHRSAYYYFLKHHDKSPFRPMAIITFLGMIVLVAFKGTLEILKYYFKMPKN